VPDAVLGWEGKYGQTLYLRTEGLVRGTSTSKNVPCVTGASSGPVMTRSWPGKRERFLKPAMQRAFRHGHLPKQGALRILTAWEEEGTILLPL
jgi:hypothetical protein